MENEVRLIDANALNKRFDEREAEDIELYGVHIADCFPSDEAKEIVDQMPTIDPESLRPKGHWDIRCDYCVDVVTREADESFYLECSECKRKVWNVNQMAAMNGEYRKLIEQYPYCHCGCKMEG